MPTTSVWKKAWELLNKSERRIAWMVLAIIIIGAVASAIMVGSVMPFLAVLAEPSRINTDPTLAWAYVSLGFSSVYHFIIALGITCFLIIVLSSAIQILRAWAIARFSMMRIHSIAYCLLETYLGQPYSFFLARHSGDMGPQVLAESERVVQQFLRPAAELVASCMTTFALVALLFWIEPVIATTSFALFGGCYGVVYILSRRALKRLGQARFDANRGRFRIANESLAGIRDIKLVGRESSYLKRFEDYSVKIAKTDVQISVLTSVPQFALQAIALGGVILLCLFLIDPVEMNSNESLGELLPVIGVFAFAGQRLMPELSKMYQSLAQIQTGAVVVEAIHRDLALRENADQLPRWHIESLRFKETLCLEEISFSYPNSDGAGVYDVSLTIRAGERIGIIGGTGAGKTTLANIVLGLLKPNFGRVIVDGKPIVSENLRAWMQSVGYVPQDMFLTDSSIAENIALGLPLCEIDSNRIQKAAKLARIHNFVEQQLIDGYLTLIGERGVRLSGGQRQRIGIARAMYQNADLIVCDEATSALDNLTETEVMDAINELPEDKTVIMIAHRLSTVKRCDRILVLDKGRVVGFDTWEGLLSQNKFFQEFVSAGSGI